MRTFLVPGFALAVLVYGALATAGELESGLAVGDGAPAFNVKDVTGPNAGKSLCYR